MTLFETAKSVPLLDICQKYGIQTERKGRKTFCTCPDRNHPDVHPSTLLNLEGQVNTFKCMSCGAKGSAIDFVSLLYGLTAKESAQKIVDEFCGGKYDKGSADEISEAQKQRNQIEKVLKSAHFTKTVINAHYKMIRDAELSENERLDQIEKERDLTEQESMTFVENTKYWHEQKQSDEASVTVIDTLIEKQRYKDLYEYLKRVKNETMETYYSLLAMDEASGSNYVRGIQ